MDDRELARRFPSGDEQVVRAVYERYGRAVHTIAVSVLHDQSAAADVVQATFLNAWRAPPASRPIGSSDRGCTRSPAARPSTPTGGLDGSR